MYPRDGLQLTVFTVLKYCDEYVCVGVCVSVCLSVREDIAGVTRTIFTTFEMHVAYGRVARSSSGRVTKSQGEGAVWVFRIDNAVHLYSITSGTHTKTAESIVMPFGMMSRLGSGNSVLRGVGVTIPEQILGKACVRQA